MRKTIFLHFPFSATFDLQTSNLLPLVTLIQTCVSIKLEVSVAFLFRENLRHVTDRRMDGRSETLSAAASMVSRITRTGFLDTIYFLSVMLNDAYRLLFNVYNYVYHDCCLYGHYYTCLSDLIFVHCNDCDLSILSQLLLLLLKCLFFSCCEKYRY